MDFIKTKPFKGSKLCLCFKFGNIVIKDVTYSFFINTYIICNAGKGLFKTCFLNPIYKSISNRTIYIHIGKFFKKRFITFPTFITLPFDINTDSFGVHRQIKKELFLFTVLIKVRNRSTLGTI